MSPLLRSGPHGGVQQIDHWGHFVAMIRPALDAEIISSEIGLIIACPNTSVIKCQNPGGGDGKDGTFHVPLLLIEVFREFGACIVDVIEPVGAIEAGAG